ncbi:helix-turn-helix transcriptional regulator [Lysinibacillus sp. G4S2]|uniref:helix-turn-helix domain-containing protein n=1 Tax=Lysinibacillus sp. G4S2 TaxID=3055859 RepID=UPI0025A12623|nr:helix-turn-helix transcriptional regulator [Lysinibacillus sp. G4S2]MDM5249634.1 helix-turn-helix transcriptional regulator [Lysinibacillus sp. G4S2]
MNKELIKHLRSITNLSQEELAERVGKHQSLISKIELGTAELTPQTQKAILNVFAEEGVGGLEIAVLNSVINKGV